MDERNISEEDIRREHISSVNVVAHWVYLFGVLGGSLIVMVLFIAFLGSGSS